MSNHVHIAGDVDAMSRMAADFFVGIAQQAIAEQGRFVVSLSGGSTPEGLFRLLAEAPYAERIEWPKVYVFWGDERCVPPDSPESNSRMARTALLNQAPVPESQIFPIDGTLPPEAAAALYDIRLREFFDWGAPVFDLVLLGLGDDGHTASLFPHTPVLTEEKRWARAVFVEKMNSWRVTLTAPALTSARLIAFLAVGEKKAGVLQKVLEGPYRPEELPAQMAARSGAEVHWFLDRSASGKLGDVEKIK